MVNVRQKAPNKLINKRGGRGRGMDVKIDRKRTLPRAPTGLDDYARKVWKAFWESAPSHAVDLGADMERLHHWVRCVDERKRLWDLVARSPLTPGTRRGHFVPNPLGRRVRELSREIERAEEAFGMTPLSRFRLQFTYAEASVATDKMEERRSRWQERRGRVGGAAGADPAQIEAPDEPEDYAVPQGWTVVGG